MKTLILIAGVAHKSAGWLFGSGNIYNDVLVIALIIVMLALLAAAVVIHRAFSAVVRLTMPEVAAVEKKKQKKDRAWQATWNRLLSLRPIEEEKDLEIEHEYDGIRELDNPIPTWFNALFYSTVAFGTVYLLVYHVFGWGLSQEQEYHQEMLLAEKAKQEFLAQAASQVDENTITVDETGSLAIAGKAVFAANCVACHGGLGEGGIGPNLTDDYWLHGSDIRDIFRVVKYGVPAKGMVPWEQTLTPAQIAEVSNYIVTLKGTNPPNAKEPQGEKVVEEFTSINNQ